MRLASPSHGAVIRDKGRSPSQSWLNRKWSLYKATVNCLSRALHSVCSTQWLSSNQAQRPLRSVGLLPICLSQWIGMPSRSSRNGHSQRNSPLTTNRLTRFVPSPRQTLREDSECHSRRPQVKPFRPIAARYARAGLRAAACGSRQRWLRHLGGPAGASTLAAATQQRHSSDAAATQLIRSSDAAATQQRCSILMGLDCATCAPQLLPAA